ncbi:MAG: hypothetical protein A2289_22760 [Deltaproteobacteria bacterium RIFOXYA12_FULL_58_15]|nr:MAG: hypothetical protein A2289_22760 [Deltaproteobacteria bacterium RIFOXYA12_FULL_58_15]OGR09269.1 MAG: hypothetical protein A2341_24310 [Deltaproteobacteria bacterium RIFOXYB12_FULL_58_9]
MIWGARRLLRRLARGQALSARESSRLWHRLKRSRSLQLEYDRIVRSERLFASGGRELRTPVHQELAPFAMRVVEEARRRQLPRNPRQRKWLWAAAPVPAALLLILLFSGPELDPEPEFGVRSQPDMTFGVRAVCRTITVTGEPLFLSLSDDPSPQEVRECPGPGVVFLAYTAESDGYLSVWMRLRGEWVVWRDAIEVGHTKELTPLPWRIRAEEHGQKSVELAFAFSASPQRPEELLILLRQAVPPVGDEVSFVFREFRFSNEHEE